MNISLLYTGNCYFYKELNIPRSTSYGVYISQLIRLLEHLAMLLT